MGFDLHTQKLWWMEFVRLATRLGNLCRGYTEVTRTRERRQFPKLLYRQNGSMNTSRPVPMNPTNPKRNPDIDATIKPTKLHNGTQQLYQGVNGVGILRGRSQLRFQIPILPSRFSYAMHARVHTRRTHRARISNDSTSMTPTADGYKRLGILLMNTKFHLANSK